MSLAKDHMLRCMRAHCRDMDCQIDITSVLSIQTPSTHTHTHLDNWAEHEQSNAVVEKKHAAWIMCAQCMTWNMNCIFEFSWVLCKKSLIWLAKSITKDKTSVTRSLNKVWSKTKSKNDACCESCWILILLSRIIDVKQSYLQESKNFTKQMPYCNPY